MPTPESSATSYAAGADLVAYYDRRTVAQLASDSGSPVADPTTDATVARLLLRCSGEVEAAAFAGGRYAPGDLAALAGAGREYLVGLVCDRAMGRLLYRRWRSGGGQGQPPSLMAETDDALKLLREGELIFGLQEAADASQPEVVNDDGTSLPVQPAVPFSVRAARGLGRRQSRQPGFYGPWCDRGGW